MVLSGMNSLEMVEENARTAADATAGCLTDRDRQLLERVKGIIRSREKVGCTGCRYCMPCPQGVDIPGIFSAWNTMSTESSFSGRTQYMQAVALTAKPAFASQCIQCGKCEKHCPQGIPIREKLKEADKALLPFPYKIGVSIFRRIMLRKPTR